MDRAATIFFKTWMYVCLASTLSLFIWTAAYPWRVTSENDPFGIFIVLGLIGAHIFFIITRRSGFALLLLNVSALVSFWLATATKMIDDPDGWGLGLALPIGVLYGVPMGLVVALVDWASSRKKPVKNDSSK